MVAQIHTILDIIDYITYDHFSWYSQFFCMFRSKLFSIDADRFLAQNVYKAGIRNMSAVREKIRVEPMFRFDHYLRSRTESELNKRMLSMYKLIEKEKDNEDYGLDQDTLIN